MVYSYVGRSKQFILLFICLELFTLMQAGVSTLMLMEWEVFTLMLTGLSFYPHMGSFYSHVGRSGRFLLV